MYRFQRASRFSIHAMVCLAYTILAAQTNLAFAEPHTIHTKDRVFYIPYTVAALPNGDQPSQIELHVSGDDGASWQMYQSQAPSDEQRFAFRAAEDGKYLFAVRTVAASGQPDKPEITSPELVVLVDQQAPAFELNASASPERTAALYWRIRDAGLIPASLKIEYRPSADDAWTAIPCAAATANVYGDELAGSTSCVLTGDAPAVELRASVSDLAGNETTIERTLPIAPAAVTSTPPMEPSLYPSTTSAAPSGLMPQMANTPAEPPSTPMAQSDIPWPIASNTEQNVGNGPNGWRSSDNPAEATGQRMTPNGPIGNMQPPPPQVGQFQMQQPPAGHQPPPQGSHRNDAEMSRNERVSQSQRFRLEYEIEGGAAVAVHRVEVWATHDNGQTWRHLGDDEDKQSPYLVSVPADGVYGFRLLVQAQEGLPVRPPLSGDQPDVWVRVDSANPTVRLTNARYGRGAELGKLIVTWNASDADLTQSPVTLLFGESPNGPWRIAAADLPNTGGFEWGVDDRIPSELYLRIEVLDRAGNLGHDTLRNPIRADGLLPKGTIRDVRPASHNQPLTFTDRMRNRSRM